MTVEKAAGSDNASAPFQDGAGMWGALLCWSNLFDHTSIVFTNIHNAEVLFSSDVVETIYLRSSFRVQPNFKSVIHDLGTCSA